MTCPEAMLKAPARVVGFCWPTLVVVFVPLILLPLPIIAGTVESKCGYVVLLMAIYWMTEALPLPVTSLFPIFLFPLLGILDVKRTCSNYMSESNFLLIGGLMVALAVEECKLHKRLALAVLLRVGTQPQYLMLGFMLATGFLSMWLNNTATVAMMLPTALIITDELIRHRQLQRCKQFAENGHTLLQIESPIELLATEAIDQNSEAAAADAIPLVLTNIQHIVHSPPGSPAAHSLTIASTQFHFLESASKAVQTESTSNMAVAGMEHPVQHLKECPENSLLKLSKSERRLSNGMLLCICYAANIGGSATLTGTGPNLVLAGQLEKIFRGQDTGINYLSWIEFALPSVAITLLLSWFWLQLIFTHDWKKDAISLQALSCCKRQGTKAVNFHGKAGDDAINAILRKKYDELESFSFAEANVTFLFLILVLLWITRHPGFVPGWDTFFAGSHVSDTCAVILIVVALFILPKEPPSFAHLAAIATGRAKGIRKPTLLCWSQMQKKFPWGIALLIGGGFAMADGITASGLSDRIGEALKSAVEGLSPAAICTVAIIVTAIFTETASNISTANIMLPIVISLAQSICINPLYFAMPATIASCFSFMLPASNPSNAIIYSTGRVKIYDMIVGGFMLSIISMAVLVLNVNTWGYWLFGLKSFPDWAQPNEQERANATVHHNFCP